MKWKRASLLTWFPFNRLLTATFNTTTKRKDKISGVEFQFKIENNKLWFEMDSLNWIDLVTNTMKWHALWQKRPSIVDVVGQSSIWSTLLLHYYGIFLVYKAMHNMLERYCFDNATRMKNRNFEKKNDSTCDFNEFFFTACFLFRSIFSVVVIITKTNMFWCSFLVYSFMGSISSWMIFFFQRCENPDER